MQQLFNLYYNRKTSENLYQKEFMKKILRFITLKKLIWLFFSLIILILACLFLSDYITNKYIDWDLFPENFLKAPIHLQHNHNTGMTEGAVHNYCNAVMWQYEHR